MCIGFPGQTSAQAFCLGKASSHDDVAAYVTVGLALEAEVYEGMSYAPARLRRTTM